MAIAESTLQTRQLMPDTKDLCFPACPLIHQGSQVFLSCIEVFISLQICSPEAHAARRWSATPQPAPSCSLGPEVPFCNQRADLKPVSLGQVTLAYIGVQMRGIRTSPDSKLGWRNKKNGLELIGKRRQNRMREWAPGTKEEKLVHGRHGPLRPWFFWGLDQSVRAVLCYATKLEKCRLENMSWGTVPGSLETEMKEWVQVWESWQLWVNSHQYIWK